MGSSHTPPGGGSAPRRSPLLEAGRVVRDLRGAGHDAWIAGGAVRDHLLGVVPKDADVATDARPEQVASLFPGCKLVGASFGVVLVPADGEPVEVATYRTDGPYLDGRHPSRVEFGTIEEDARRRDFTVNGMYMDPDSGEILDLVGGRADLDARRLRAIGNPHDRFGEDHLRLLRAVRLAAQLGFTLDEDTRAAATGLAPRITRVAPERSRDELIRLLTGPDPKRALELLRETRLLNHLLPELAATVGVPQPPEYHPEGDVWTHTVLLFDHLDRPSPELALAALLHDIGKPPTFEPGPDRIRFPRHARVGAEMAEGICRRYRLSNDSTERVTELVAHHMRFIDVHRMRTSTLKRFLRMPGFDEHLALHRADCLSSHRHLDNWEFARARREEFGEEELRPPRLADGHELIAMGWEAGPELGRELRHLEELQLDGRIATKEEALEIARRDLERRGS